MFQRTFGMVKPDVVGRNQIGAVLTCVEENGLQIEALARRRLTRPQARLLYVEHEGKEFFEGLIDFTVSGPVVLMALEGENAIESYRQLMTGTLRPRFGTDVRRNAVHGSADPASAMFELQLFFPGLGR